MQRTDIAEDVLEFLARRIDSVPHLEALLLFHEYPDKLWTGGEIAARVYVSRDRGHAILDDLARHGFITPQKSEGFCYQPAWDEAQLMPRVADAYRVHLVQVTELIHAKGTTDSVQEFARAFKFTKKD